MDLAIYRVMVFDCDGVVLDSNRIKTEAFYNAAMPWGAEPAEALVSYHVRNGGASRYAKFAHFIDHILPEHAQGPVQGNREALLEGLLRSYAEGVRRGLRTCAIAEGLGELRRVTSSARWMIVSGGDQAELREVFTERGIADFFDAGIYGSPKTKVEILAELKSSGQLLTPAVFFGDSALDYDAASQVGIDFVFVSGWSEMPGWQGFILEHDLKSLEFLDGLTL